MTSFEGEPKSIVIPGDTSLRDEIQAKHQADSEAERLRQEEVRTVAKSKRDKYPKVLELIKDELVELADILEQEGVLKTWEIPITQPRKTRSYYGYLHFLEIGPYNEVIKDVVAGQEQAWLLETVWQTTSLTYGDLEVPCTPYATKRTGLTDTGGLVTWQGGKYKRFTDSDLLTEGDIQPHRSVTEQPKHEAWHESIVGWGAKLLEQAEK